MYQQYPLLRAFRCAAITLVLATALEGLRNIPVPGLSAWQSHIAAILVCAAIVFLLALVGFLRERSTPQHFSEPDQPLRDISGHFSKPLAVDDVADKLKGVAVHAFAVHNGTQ